MKRFTVVAAIALVGASLASALYCLRPVHKKLYANDIRGKAAPDLAVEQWLTPRPDSKGKVVLVDFWATWCPPCREAIPELSAFQKRFKGDLVVIGITNENAATVQAFMKTTPIDYSVALDSKHTAATAIGVVGIPHVLIISTDNIVRWQGYPFSTEEPLTADAVQKIIDADPGIAARHREDKAKTENALLQTPIGSVHP